MVLDNEVKHKRVNDRDLSIFTYSKKESSISMEDYFELLNEYLSKEGMTFDYISYDYENDNGYMSSDIITNVNRIRDVLKSFLYTVDSYFTDDKNNYRLSFSPVYDEKITLVMSKIVDLDKPKTM